MQDMSQECRFVLRIEKSMTNPVKAIAKNTRGGSLLLFDPNGCDLMSPRTDMIRPTKRDG
jgi:hypothetical protein